MTEKKHRFLWKLAPLVQGLAGRTGLPASVILAQAILESDWGCSALARRHRNLFGIKASAGANASEAVVYPTTEYRGGQPQRERARFAHYASYEQCLEDYARVLSRPRYARARAVAANPLAFAVELQRCGYATDPRYAHKLAVLIRRYRLTQYDVAVEAGTAPGQELSLQSA
ncbi:MAG: glucosaminidase domain-containing protein [Acidobacteria bacterium]|nr:glucosaminidase domain-containing protein [Acidobacteriota bacterium]